MKNLKINSVTQFVEAAIALELAHALIKAGYKISVNDGEETVLTDSTDVETILSAMFTTDSDYWYIDPSNTKILNPNSSFRRWCYFIRFIYGNDGFDVVNDYSTRLEKIIDPIIDRYWENHPDKNPTVYNHLLQLLHADLERNKK